MSLEKLELCSFYYNFYEICTTNQIKYYFKFDYLKFLFGFDIIFKSQIGAHKYYYTII